MGGRRRVGVSPGSVVRGHGLPLDPRFWGGVADLLSDLVQQFVQKRDFDEAEQERRKASAPRRCGK